MMSLRVQRSRCILLRFSANKRRCWCKNGVARSINVYSFLSPSRSNFAKARALHIAETEKTLGNDPVLESLFIKICLFYVWDVRASLRHFNFKHRSTSAGRLSKWPFSSMTQSKYCLNCFSFPVSLYIWVICSQKMQRFYFLSQAWTSNQER